MRIDVDRDESEFRGNGRPDAEGFFHTIVTAVDDTLDSYSDKVTADFRILAGTEESQVGRTYREFFSTSEKALARLKLFGLACKAARRGESFEVSSCVGRQCVIELKRNSYTAQTGEEATARRRKEALI